MKMILTFLTLLIGSNLYCQTPNDIIKGNVKDVYGEILLGVNIVVVHNEKNISYAVSDINGNYSLSIPDSLVEFEVKFLYIGFKEKVVIVNREKKKNEKSKKC